MSENTEKVKLETILAGSTNSAGSYVYLGSLAMAVAEAYEVALAAGWETKALDPLNGLLREYHNT